MLRVNSFPVFSGKKMLTTDMDGTFLIPTKENIKYNVEERTYDPISIEKAESSVRKNNIDAVLINTGRNFTELKEVEDILKASTMPIEAVSLQDGKRLLRKPESLTPQQWMAYLFNDKINYTRFQDENWHKKSTAPRRAIEDFLLNEKGYIHRKNDGENLIYSKPVEITDKGVKSVQEGALWILTLDPVGIKYELRIRGQKPSDDIDLDKYNEALISEISQMLEQRGFNIDGHKKEKRTTIINTIEDLNVNKGAVADYVHDNLASKVCEVRSGDAENDISMLKTTKRNVEVIQVGQNSDLRKLLAPMPNVTQVPSGELGTGIDIALSKFDMSA